MKTRIAFAALVLPAAFAGFTAFHPGVALGQTPLAKKAPAQLQAGSYTVDPLHTSIGFEINHLGLSSIQGRFTKKSGKLNVDPRELNKSSVEFAVETESVDTAVAPRDSHLRTSDFFDVAKYPQMTFKSTRIRKSGAGYVAEGRLTIKETSKNVAIPFKVYGPITDPWGGTRIGVVAEPVTINRQEFGIAYDQKLPDGTPAVSNDVTIKVSLEATRDK